MAGSATRRSLQVNAAKAVSVEPAVASNGSPTRHKRRKKKRSTAAQGLNSLVFVSFTLCSLTLIIVRRNITFLSTMSRRVARPVALDNVYYLRQATPVAQPVEENNEKESSVKIKESVNEEKGLQMSEEPTSSSQETKPPESDDGEHVKADSTSLEQYRGEMLVEQDLVDSSKDGYDDPTSSGFMDNVDIESDNFLRIPYSKVLRMYDYDEQLMNSRSERFPSVTDRVKVYMSDWYTPPCEDNSKSLAKYKHTSDQRLLIREVPTVAVARPRTFEMEPEIGSTAVFFMDIDKIMNCNHEYCNDAKKFIVPTVRRIAEETGNDRIPYFLRFGDHEQAKAFVPAHNAFEKDPNLPIIRKFRRAISKDDIAKLTSRQCNHFRRDLPSTTKAIQPIIWFMKTFRHYGGLPHVHHDDMQWEEKLDAAVFRGGLTGVYRHGLTWAKIDRGLSDEEICELIPRCKLVYNAANSELVNARLTPSTRRDFADREQEDVILPRQLNGVDLFGEKVSRQDLLQFKAIIMLEGNDVSSGLKWALISNSVVMMPPPTMTSWAMEELLEPWVHYIPLNDDLSDVEEQVQWMIDHDDEARNIARQGALWMKDLVFHPDADRDNHAVFDEMIRRYRAHFVEDPGLTP